MDPLEAKMKADIDAIDALKDKEIQNKKDELAKISNFKKIFAFLDPQWAVIPVIFCSMIVGAAMPAVGATLSKLLTYMTASWEILGWLKLGDINDQNDDFDGTAQEYLAS